VIKPMAISAAARGRNPPARRSKSTFDAAGGGAAGTVVSVAGIGWAVMTTLEADADVPVPLADWCSAPGRAIDVGSAADGIARAFCFERSRTSSAVSGARRLIGAEAGLSACRNGVATADFGDANRA
jgi:hypothetical protein